MLRSILFTLSLHQKKYVNFCQIFWVVIFGLIVDWFNYGYYPHLLFWMVLDLIKGPWYRCYEDNPQNNMAVKRPKKNKQIHKHCLVDVNHLIKNLFKLTFLPSHLPRILFTRLQNNAIIQLALWAAFLIFFKSTPPLKSVHWHE